MKFTKQGRCSEEAQRVCDPRAGSTRDGIQQNKKRNEEIMAQVLLAIIYLFIIQPFCISPNHY